LCGREFYRHPTFPQFFLEMKRKGWARESTEKAKMLQFHGQRIAVLTSF
jgi:hypothetical protein